MARTERGAADVRTRWLYLAGAAVLAVCDQATKAAAAGYLTGMEEGRAVRLIKGILYLKPTTNRGGIWGFLDGFPSWVFVALSAVFVVYLAVLIARLGKTEQRYLPALALLLGGFAGNGIDRLRNGCVTDFIYVTAGPPWLLSTFNLADLAILAGAAWLAGCFLLTGLRGKTQQRIEP